MSEPPRSTIRRTVAILATSFVLVVVAGVPAWAGSSLAPAEVPADTDQPLTLTVTEPEDEAYGDTARVTVKAPTGFTVLACGSTPVGWNCAVAEDGTGITYVRDAPVSLGTASRDFGFSVHTPVVNGSYAFRVTQADGPPNEEDPPAAVSSQPAVTVTGGQEPTPKPSPTPPADDGGSQTDDDSQTDDGSQTDDDTSGSDPQPTDTTPDDGSQDSDTGSDAASTDTSSTDDDSASGGSTAPRRTQGRASGTTLEIIPGEASDDDPGVVQPDVADDPAIAPPDDDDSTAAAASGTEASEEPGSGAPWQQWVGAAMLLAGLVTVGVRRLWERRTT